MIFAVQAIRKSFADKLLFSRDWNHHVQVVQTKVNPDNLF
jgi:hypothetical protein